MSVRLMGLIFDSRTLSSTEKLIMLALADHANDEGKSIYPSQNRLSQKTGLARGTVNKHIQILIDKGYLNRVRYRQDYSNTLELEIIAENLSGQGVTENDTPPQEGVTEDDTSDPEGVTQDDRGCHGELQGGVTQDDIKHHFNHQLNQINVFKDLPVEEKEACLIFYFSELTSIPIPPDLARPREYAKWLREIGAWVDLGVIPEDVRKAVVKSDKSNLTLAWPGSITKYLTSIVARRKRGVQGEQPQKSPIENDNDALIKEMIENGEI